MKERRLSRRCWFWGRSHTTRPPGKRPSSLKIAPDAVGQLHRAGWVLARTQRVTEHGPLLLLGCKHGAARAGSNWEQNQEMNVSRVSHPAATTASASPRRTRKAVSTNASSQNTASWVASASPASRLRDAMSETRQEFFRSRFSRFAF